MLETPKASFQDTAFTFKTLLYANDIYYMPQMLVYYSWDNESSSVKDFSNSLYLRTEFEEIERVCPQEERAIMAKFRFKQYMWNYSRLNAAGRAEFEKIMQEDFIRDSEYVERSFYNDVEWAEYIEITEDSVYGE